LSNLTTVTFFKFNSLSAKSWAFAQMGIAPRHLTKVENLSFFKLMGSGAGNGFSLKPDFSVYALLAVWDTEASAKSFFTKDSQFSAFRQMSHQHMTLYLKANKLKGLWDKHQPFDLSQTTDYQGPIAVLTRAKINANRLVEFWKHVPKTSRAIEGREGLLFSKGVGEWPIFQQATISVWSSKEAMVEFAYKDEAHRKIIQLTHERNWYSEEMFVEFVPVGIEGEWEDGVDLFKSIVRRTQ